VIHVEKEKDEKSLALWPEIRHHPCMKTDSALTSRILALLSDVPTTSADIWDDLGDENVRLVSVRTELNALLDEGRVVVSEPRGLTRTYVLAAQAVAS
jgi:predicted GNAT superfamily acetyltransferase